ncbi:c-type cytochrome [Tropicimonas sp. IMCC6043]|uniref:c-type cytochrome n=1 Tax=Tropicimonas sp. IMCC6043 TaxID=2510645 RepID=UPI00101B7646|nr:c-type cytochrome [Tropicimonas sp. IMCC6043]RYH12379.1 hypothetical protein EU800_02130 [Tropicimonas sp. IMCC6043]
MKRAFQSVKYLCLAGIAAGLAGQANAEHGDLHDYAHSEEAQEYIHGDPEQPTDTWTLSAGGRIYDNWWNALDREPPETTHPSYPAAGAQSGSTTWRCKECHGWDYRGAEGIYSSGSHYTGIKGIYGAIGANESAIAELLRGPDHAYTEDMIDDEEMARLAAFVSRGQIDMSRYVNLETREIRWGDLNRGRAIFQSVCAACHGFDGRAYDWGDDGEHAYVGTEAAAAPDEVMGKIMNGHPGVAMINLRAFGPEAAHDALSYSATLPQ